MVGNQIPSYVSRLLREFAERPALSGILVATVVHEPHCPLIRSGGTCNCHAQVTLSCDMSVDR